MILRLSRFFLYVQVSAPGLEFRKRFSLLTCCVLFAAPAYTWGSDTSIPIREIGQNRSFKDKAESLIDESHLQLRTGLSPEDQAIEKAVRYEIVEDETTANASAQRVDGVNFTFIGLGLLSVMDWVSTALAIDSEFGEHSCATAYITQLAADMNGNGAAALQNQAPKKVGSPFIFAQSHTDLCPAMSELTFRSRARALSIRDLYFAGSIKLIIAHELGHHIHRDTWSPPANDEESRAREAAADSFCFRTLALSGTVPIEGLPVMILATSIEGFSVEKEVDSDHPAAVRRLRNLIEESERAADSDEAVRAALIRSGRMQEWRQMIMVLKQQLDQLETRE